VRKIYYRKSFRYYQNYNNNLLKSKIKTENITKHKYFKWINNFDDLFLYSCKYNNIKCLKKLIENGVDYRFYIDEAFIKSCEKDMSMYLEY